MFGKSARKTENNTEERDESEKLMNAIEDRYGTFVRVEQRFGSGIEVEEESGVIEEF